MCEREGGRKHGEGEGEGEGEGGDGRVREEAYKPKPNSNLLWAGGQEGKRVRGRRRHTTLRSVTESMNVDCVSYGSSNGTLHGCN